MAQSFKETAHLKTDLKKYNENYDKIFGKKKKDSPKEITVSSSIQESKRERDIVLDPGMEYMREKIFNLVNKEIINDGENAFQVETQTKIKVTRI